MGIPGFQHTQLFSKNKKHCQEAGCSPEKIGNWFREEYTIYGRRHKSGQQES